MERNNDRDSPEGNSTNIGDITISCFSPTGSTKVIKELLKDVEDFTKSEPNKKTSIYKVSPNGSRWISFTVRDARDIESVAMDPVQRKRIHDEIKEYQGLKDYYRRQGKPYRKGYLLYGPPGTGKTSLVLALAGTLGLPLFVLSLTDRNLTDSSLERLFDELPSGSIVLMEDIDSAGIQRENMSKSAEGSKATKGSRLSRITLSGLLNAIDGPASAEGRILIMTTNAKDTLDKALIRDGRIDEQFEMGYASKAVAASLFDRIYVNKDDKPFEHIIPESTTREGLNRLCAEFSANIPDERLSPAEIQGFLMQHRKEPRKAVELVEEWCRKKLNDRDTDSSDPPDGGVLAQEEDADGSEAELEDDDRSFLRMILGM